MQPLTLPQLILPNGTINPAWAKAYQEQTGVNHLEAHTQQQAAIVKMDEPPLTTGKGKLNPVWVMWYKARKRVSTKIATSVGKTKLNSGDTRDEQEQPKEHRTYYW